MAQVIGEAVPLEANPFERIGIPRRRPSYTVEPASIAWNAVAFKLSGHRDAIACIPRASLDQFLDDLDAGRLDESISGFLAAPPTGRILSSAEQTGTPGLFDELGAVDAIAPDERAPGRPGRRGRGGGGAAGSRRDKRSRAPRPRRGLVAGAVVVVVLAAVGGIVVATRDDGKATSVAVGDSAPKTTLDPTQPVPIEGATSPPDLAAFPKGAVLFQGTSGDEIGCIPCDGAFRIMSIEHPGITLSGAGAPEEVALLSAPLTADGVVTRLGVRLSSADGGNWTLNVRCKSTETPGSCGSPSDVPVNATPGTIGFAMACSVPVGATACVRWDPEDGRTVKAGDRLALAVGNPGKPATEGHFTMEWWFVFVPSP